MNTPLENEIAKRFGVLPNFFGLASSDPQITANLWGFARFAYLDNPLPSSFKERLFVYLSRFCEVRYCIARHVGLLTGLGYPAGDSSCPPQTVESIVTLLRRPLPRGEKLLALYAVCSECDSPLTSFPAPDSLEEQALFACATHVFLQTSEAPQALEALRSPLGPINFEQLNLLLAFVRTAHYWTKLHPELVFEDDINQLLAAHENLAECILKDPEAQRDTLSLQVATELKVLRKLRSQHESMAQAFQELSVDHRYAKHSLRETEENLRELISVIPASVYACDREGVITYFNPHVVEIWGCAPELDDLPWTFLDSRRMYRIDGTQIEEAPVRGGNTGTTLAMPVAFHSPVSYNGRSGQHPMRNRFLIAAVMCAVAATTAHTLRAQSVALKYEVDRAWPKPFPDRWVMGGLGGVCVDLHDHVFLLNRQDVPEIDLNSGHLAPAIIEIDTEGNLVNSWSAPQSLDPRLHSCYFDKDNNMWIASSPSGMVQKYSHDGSKLLQQIGKKGVLDSSDGTEKGRPLNSNAAQFFMPASIFADPQNGDVYIADGEGAGGNRRIAVIDRNGKFLRQWQPEGMRTVHCLSVAADGLVYVCNRQESRIQVYDKLGNFKRNIETPWTPYTTPPDGKPKESGGAAVALDLSRDTNQKFMYLLNQNNEQVEVLDRESGKVLTTFGHAGHFTGEFDQAHGIAVDSQGNVYVAENRGRRIQKFKPVRQ